MKNRLQSCATIDSCRWSASSLHNCPSCRCGGSHWVKGLHVPCRAGAFDSPRNLYVSQHFEESERGLRSGEFPFQSGLFQKGITVVGSPPASPKPTNITFTYLSPPKKRQHHSAGSKFTTKTFKQRHFPLLNLRESEGVDQAADVKGFARKESDRFKIFTDQQTPKKHKLLKMNKAKSKQKLEITISKRSSSRGSQQGQAGRNGKVYNDYGVVAPSPTPIQSLWSQNVTPQSNSNSNSKVVSQSQIIACQPKIQASFVKYSQSAKNSSNSSHPLSKFAESNLIFQDNAPPSIQSIDPPPASARSIDAYSDRAHFSPHFHPVGQPREMSVDLFKDRSCKESGEMNVEEIEEMELGRTISEQLQLNFDYYVARGESDRSLSLNVSL